VKIIEPEELSKLLDYLSKSPESDTGELNIDQLISVDGDVNFQDEEKKINDKFNNLIDELKQFSLDQEVSFAYSRIADSIYNNTSDNEKENENKFAEIQTNIEYIIDKLKQRNYKAEKLIANLYKLGEFIRVDYLRFSAIGTIKNELKKSKYELEKEIEKIKKELNGFEKKINSKYKKVSDNIKKTQTNYITILGIFAAIILTFVSGLVFSNSILQNIDKASIYKLLLISTMIGFFITNILLFLFNFVKSITRNNKNNSILDPHISYFNLAAIILILVLFAVSVSHESIYKKYDSNSTINVNTANIGFSSNR